MQKENSLLLPRNSKQQNDSFSYDVNDHVNYKSKNFILSQTSNPMFV